MHFEKSAQIFSLSFESFFSFNLELNSTLKRNEKCLIILMSRMWKKEIQNGRASLVFGLGLLLFKFIFIQWHIDYSFLTPSFVALLIYYMFQIHLHSNYFSLHAVWIYLTSPANTVSHSSLVSLCSFQAGQHALPLSLEIFTSFCISFSKLDGCFQLVSHKMHCNRSCFIQPIHFYLVS